MSEIHDEIVVKYNLLDNWAKYTEFSFDHLLDVVTQLHESAYTASVKAINRFATVRNYAIGFYIVEYEQHGSDLAKYGDRLLINLAEKVNKRSINKTLLYNCRKFYLDYPQLQPCLERKSATASHKSEIFPTASEDLKQKIPTASGKMDNNLFVSTYMLSLPDKNTLQNFILSQLNDE